MNVSLYKVENSEMNPHVYIQMTAKMTQLEGTGNENWTFTWGDEVEFFTFILEKKQLKMG